MNISGTVYEPSHDSVPHTARGDSKAPLIPPTWSTSLANTFSNLTNNSSFAGLKFSNLGDTRSRHNTSSFSGPRVSGLDNARSRSSSLINMPSFSGPRPNNNDNPSSVGPMFPNPLFTGPNVLMSSDLDNTRPRISKANENSNVIESNISSVYSTSCTFPSSGAESFASRHTLQVDPISSSGQSAEGTQLGSVPGDQTSQGGQQEVIGTAGATASGGVGS